MKNRKFILLNDYLRIIGLENIPEITKRALREKLRKCFKKNESYKNIFNRLVKNLDFYRDKTIPKIMEHEKLIQEISDLLKKTTKLQKKYFISILKMSLNN